MQKLIPLLLCSILLLAVSCGDSSADENLADTTPSTPEAPAAPSLPAPATFDAFLNLYPELAFPFDLYKEEMADFLDRRDLSQFAPEARDRFLEAAIEKDSSAAETFVAAYGKVMLKSDNWMLLTYLEREGDHIFLSTFTPEGEFAANKEIFFTPTDLKAERKTCSFRKSPYGKFSVSRLTPSDFNGRGEPIAFMTKKKDFRIYGDGTFGYDQ